MHGVELEARSGLTRFSAIQDNDYGLTFLSALTRERSGRVKITREANRLVPLDAGEFTFDEGLTSAHVGPGGALFTGSADYTSPGNWTGSLAVSFPGEATVALAAAGFEATLRSGKLAVGAWRRPERPHSIRGGDS
jgi:hypothetical protein